MEDAPEFATASGIEFPGVGRLVGYTLNDAPFSREHVPEVTLVWQAGTQTPSVRYTATVQLVDAAGQVIAQSDAVPGGRETTGWRAGEYILDRHVLAFNERAGTGTVRLIVALYDAQTGERVLLADSADAAELQAGITIE